MKQRALTDNDHIAFFHGIRGSEYVQIEQLTQSRVWSEAEIRIARTYISDLMARCRAVLAGRPTQENGGVA